MKTNLVTLLTVMWIGSLAWAGGTTAGGGNVAVPDQVKAADLESAIQMLKPVVTSWYTQLYFNYLSLKRLDMCKEPRNVARCATAAKLFDSAPTVIDLLQNLEIEIKKTSPCLDFYKVPADGSMFGEKPGSICISVSNIQPKLREDNYENQIAALLAHEVSHLKGTTEDEANDLQQIMLIISLSDV